MTAEEIHTLGLAEVARLRTEMEAIKARSDSRARSTSSSGSCAATGSSTFRTPIRDAQTISRSRRRYLGDMQKRLPEYFGLLPKAGLIVKRVEPFREEPGGAQHYFGGTPDGSRPGIFYAHLSDMNAMPKFQLEDVAYHEGVPWPSPADLDRAASAPGCRSSARSTATLPSPKDGGCTRSRSARRWGSSRIPIRTSADCAGEIWRAIRLVVDTGLHAKGWTEEQAVKYFLANSPQPERSVRSEIRRYLVNPGQATSYKIGMITIQKLRDEARQALGGKFDYRAFHDVVLGGGSVPLPVLEAAFGDGLPPRGIASRPAALGMARDACRAHARHEEGQSATLPPTR